MCGIAQQRILDHALGHAQSHISWSCVQIAFRILHGFPGFQWISNGSSMDLHQVFGALLILLQTFTLWQVTTATFEFVLAIAQARINRLASKCSVDIDITRHPPSHSCSEAPAEVNHAAQTLLESTGVELEVVPSGYRPES